MVIISDIDGCINDLVDKTLSMYNSETGKNECTISIKL